jgi:molybdate transport system permease protein
VRTALLAFARARAGIVAAPIRTTLFRLLLVAALAISVAALLLPLVGLVTRVPPGEVVRQLRTHAVEQALLVTLRTSLIAQILILGIGTPAAYLLSQRRFPGRTLLVTALELPLVLPPAIAGIALFAAFGREGLLGRPLGALGLEIPFTELAVVLAIVLVAGPLYLRQAIAAFESLDQRLLEVARTLGARPARVFLRVALPLAASGLAAGAALSLARGIGEFGATIIFAGSIPGITQTLPLAAYSAFGTDLNAMFAIGVLGVAVSAAVLLVLKLLPLWKPSTSRSL